MRLIDADNLIPMIKYATTDSEIGVFPIKIGFDAIKKVIDEMPTIDAEPVVRCKDCRWGREVCGNIECSVDHNLPPEYHGYEWFCPNGERRTNEVN